MFRRLRSKLTVLYAGLFCAALSLIGATAYAVIAGNTQRLVSEELDAAGAVFDRLWQLRFDHLQDGARVSASDYGFRQAIASRDSETIRSALANLRLRLDADLVELITPSGQVFGEAGPSEHFVSNGLQAALDADEAPYGVLAANDALYQAVTVPVLAPDLLGWIVVGARLDDEQMTGLERLSAIPLQARVLARSADGQWGSARDARLGAFVAQSLAQHDGRPSLLMEGNGRAVGAVRPLHSMDGTRAVLLLRHSLASALTPYRTLFDSLIAIGALGVTLLLAGAWVLSNGITRPLSRLEAAARKLREGVYEPVAVHTSDEISQLAASFNAMSDAIRAREKRITQLAYHDIDTRLPNRLALERRIAAAPAQRVYLAAVGIDRFAEVRGAIGYALAGALVRSLGARLALLAPGAALARLSSDVLGVTFVAQDEASAALRAKSLVAGLEQPLSLDGQAVDITVSVGVAQPRSKDEAPAHMIERASIALDQARAARVKTAFFDEAAYGDPARNLSLMGELGRALASGALTLAHQPKYSFRSRRIESAETLVRWRHPSRGPIPPDLFVRMAEETGHIRALTEWVVRQAVVEQQLMSDAGFPLSLSINVSGRLLGDDDFARNAMAIAKRAPHPICFEITETAIVDNPEAAIANIARFAASGITVAIDDYGSGFSSLAYLKRLPAHELKIDRMFVEGVTTSQRDALLVRSTIDLGHGLGMKVTAEGVEHPAAFALLAAMGCDMAQGYLVARPSPVNELVTILGDAARLEFYHRAAASSAAR